MEQQTDFNFTEGISPRAEPLRKVSVPRRGSSICAYCGMRMPSALLDTRPPADDNRWTIAAPYHAPTCRWIVTKGLRIDPRGRSS
jgi:hypothetical protein